jgi:hypothetical protein
MPAKRVVPVPAASTPDGSGGSLIRKIGPAIPLAIPLALGMLHGSLSTPPAAPAAPAPQTISATGGNTLAGVHCGGGTADSPACTTPYPMLEKGHPVDWWFVFKFNAAKFPKCGGGADGRACPFGGTVQPYTSFGQRYVYASAESATLADGAPECLGDGTGDPVGATFDEVYNGNFHYLIWNDQPYGDPAIDGCSGDGCSAPWGHSKGMLAWNDAGEGFVMQVSTPDWPLSGSPKYPRKTEGNSLGCVRDDDVMVSQHFFALRLTKDDLVTVLKTLANASVVTDPKNPQIANNGGPADVQALVSALGSKSASTTVENTVLSTGVRLIGKPSDLNVPPWQMVSSVLGGVSLRTATWWASPEIYSTAADTTVGCWSSTLGKPGAVEIATSGTWENTVFSLKGGLGTDANHAKLGVSTSGTGHYAIFGDENQQGTLSGTNCGSSQNGRGGMFFAMDNAEMAASLTSLLTGTSAPVQ